MIKIDNVSKSYVSQSKQRVNALTEVSFTLPDTGMVFILGKSGSGKSTLLNLLGGLDSPTGGEITVDGVSMKNFSSTDYDSYRNSFVGFIFQEYNLLDDFNVQDNVALALQLSKEDNVEEKVKAALQQVELSDDYLLRRVGEMSGGEKQRVAIARSIVKDSRMILADEPTGNLDSATGESIWHILKRLSQTKLVVVVSHDRESAEKYADRVVEIADGRIVSDSGAATVEQKQENKDGAQAVTTATAPKGLPLRACLQMSLNNLSQRKAKTVSVILISILTILTLLITEMFLAFSPLKTIANFINRYDVPYFAVQQWIRDDEGELYYRHILRGDTRSYLDQNSEYIVGGVVENKQQLLDFGFTFEGEALELTPTSYYVTKYTLQKYIQLDSRGANYYLDDNGKKVTLIEETPFETLIGKRVYIAALTHNDTVNTLAGIIDTDGVDENVLYYLPPIFTTADYEDRHYWRTSDTVNNVASNARLQLGDNSYQKTFDICSYVPTDGRSFGLLTADGLLTGDEIREMTLADDEIVLTYELYAELFEAKSKFSYVDSDVTQVKDGVELPAELNQKVSLKFYNAVSNDLIVDLGEFKLVGIVFQSFYTPEERTRNYKIGVNEQHCKTLQDLLDISQSILIKTDSVKHLSSFLITLNNKYDTRTVNVGHVEYVVGSGSTHDVVDEVYSMIDTMNSTLFIMIAICVIMVVLLVLLVINLISFSITNRKREIGILSALGTSNKDITKIFIFETLVIAAISFVVTLILSFVFAAVLNVVASMYYVDIIIAMFRVDILTIAVLAVASFGLLLLAAWIPTRKIAKLKPIDAIRNV